MWQDETDFAENVADDAVRIKVTAGSGGFGGPLYLSPTAERNKIAYVTGGGIKPDVAVRLEELTGCVAVNGFNNPIKDEEIFAVVIDCAGSLRCGIYPKKQIPTINIMPTGKSGPLAKYIKEDIYVSAVTVEEVCLCDQAEEEEGAVQNPVISQEKTEMENNAAETTEKKFDTIGRLGMKTGFVIQTFYKSSQDAVDTILRTLIPLMGFVSLFMGIIEYSGLGTFLSNHLKFLGAGSILGLILLGLIGSIPFLSPILSPGAIIAQVVGAFIGVQIANGAMPAYLALPALYAINTQAACDFIPVGLGLADAKEDTIRIGVPSVLMSRFLTSVPRVCGAWIACLFLKFIWNI
ncbi:MAG: PTS sorbitol transporter subunit IIB [Hespellia sp.]|nr:PTS sorbitol transporter subunit IIB [Hespellia sp.]